MKIGDKMVTYTAFNDAIQSFLTNIKCDTAVIVDFVRILNTLQSKMVMYSVASNFDGIFGRIGY